MASSSFVDHPHVTLEVVEEEYPYPYPTNLSATSFTSVKLSGRDEYAMWKTQMLCLLESHDMLGFINGTLVRPQTSASGKEKVGDHQTRHRLWRRSDALAKGWIIGSLSKQTFRYVLNRLTEKVHPQTNADFSAKDVWDELKTIYGPAFLPQLQNSPTVLPQVPGADKQQPEEEEEGRAVIHQELNEATLSGYWNWVVNILRKNKVTVTEEITYNGNTALHVAVGTAKKPDFLLKMLKWTPVNTDLSAVKNSDGSTLLHVAAIVGNIEAAKILVAAKPDLLLAQNQKGHTPLAIALSNMDTKLSQFLLQHIKNDDTLKATLFSGTSGDELLVTVICSKDFRLARDLVKHYDTLHTDTVLMAVAQNFRELNTLENYIGTDLIRSRVDTSLDYMIGRCVPLCGSWVEIILRLFYAGIYGIIMLFILILKMFVWPFAKDNIRTNEDAIKVLWKVCKRIRNSKDPSSHHHYYRKPLLEATRQNASHVVHQIVLFFPNAIWSTNEDGHNIIQFAVISRSEKVYNLIYQMSDHKNIYRTMKDSCGNSLLHLAARLAPSNKLNLISGAALQIQRELQWFKEVESFVCPLNITQKNSFDETPEMVFTREHKELVIAGEKWMKTTAESYTITAALITTIVFAAAITVPGGNNQDTGIPIFTNNTAFTIFAISDAISLFAAVTSLLLFLSILTARFAEHDFLFKLPTKLIIGLATLFISTTAMIVAFGATLYIVFGQSNSRILISIGVLTCLPITSFVTLQFPLVVDLMSATYGCSIFGKKSPIFVY